MLQLVPEHRRKTDLEESWFPINQWAAHLSHRPPSQREAGQSTAPTETELGSATKCAEALEKLFPQTENARGFLAGHPEHRRWLWDWPVPPPIKFNSKLAGVEIQ